MNDPAYLAFLTKAIKATHGCGSRHVESVAVKETFQGKTVWEGDVEVFDLIGHPKAKRCYAWAYDGEAGGRAIAVLELPPVISPITAVRVGIIGERKAMRKN